MDSKNSKPSPGRPTASSNVAPKWSYLSAAALGLLSSSCCVIQLVLNAFSIGCAGFSVLTPFRPIFTSISFLLILYTIYKYRFSSRTALTLAITILLTIAPEMVSVYNQSPSGLALRDTLANSLGAWPPLQPLVQRYHQDSWKMFSNDNAGIATDNGKTTKQPGEPSDNLSSDRNDRPGSSAPLVKYDIEVHGMACEACANRLRQYFISKSGIEHVKVFFDEKRMELWTRSGPGAFMLSEKNIQDMVAQVDNKYEAKLVATYSVQKQGQ
ncbi:hypothetical protein B0O80DRAFT_502201 [Mortierella sp. GBAus27b]|nr:hypothetical protein BGX31_011373 [Mortierella sp. GBA43]KAI8348063.1 hypothetical protein B0O80DRAFT_502201 [Mortierella sp. GBAus27b]